MFVNGSRIASQPVPPGPFTVNDVPLVSGAGDVQLVVRDPFGQQQVITQPFYASRRLLRGGLDEFQWSLGATRENYGLASFDYGSPLASGYLRSGISDRLTVETRFEADEDVRESARPQIFRSAYSGFSPLVPRRATARPAAGNWGSPVMNIRAADSTSLPARCGPVRSFA